MLETLKQISAFGLKIIKVNTNFLEKESRMYHKSVFIHTMYKIATKVLMIGKSLYLRIVKRTNNLKKGKPFWQHRLKTFYPLGLNGKEEYLKHKGFFKPLRSDFFILFLSSK